MALGKKCGLKVKRGGVNAEEGFRQTRALERKRTLIWDDVEASPLDSTLETTPKKKRKEEPHANLSAERSPLEALPQDILIRILCGVNHDDLKQLFHVSKSIQEATLIAKRLHFAYSTPSKTGAFLTSIDLKDSSEFAEIEAPNAPKQSRIPRSRVCQKKLADISVALFASPDEDRWPRTRLLIESEI